MKAIDLRRIKRADTPLYRSFLDGLKAGSTVGLRTAIANCQLYTNGLVTAVQGDSIWAEFPRLETTRFSLDRVPSSHVELPTGKPLRKGMLTRGQTVDVIETYPNGTSCMVSGDVTGLIADAFQVDGQWVMYGGKDAHGKTRKLTARLY